MSKLCLWLEEGSFGWISLTVETLGGVHKLCHGLLGDVREGHACLKAVISGEHRVKEREQTTHRIQQRDHRQEGCVNPKERCATEDQLHNNE